MLRFPNAKINLGLRILERLPNGYHTLETIFLPISLCDILEVVPAEKKESTDTWVQNGIIIEGAQEENTVLRTVAMLRNKGYKIPPLSIELLKKIPFGAGMGGGSADAASMLILLNDMFSLGLTQETMARYIKEIGADCPFFIYNRPMIGRGIGEVLSPITLPEDVTKARILLVKPPIAISTKEAYEQIKCHPEAANTLERLLQQPLEKWRDSLINDFEAPLFIRYPQLKEIKNSLYEHGAFYASMSGSGSTLYGLFEGEIPAILPSLFEDCFVWQGNMT